MTKTLKTLAVLLAAVLVLSACGQRVYPKEPEGKIQPSRAY